ncbi:type 1 fimbrial protein [Salmonella enterica]|nr:type 1 fimbrial protein [Salmonella enterica]
MFKPIRSEIRQQIIHYLAAMCGLLFACKGYAVCSHYNKQYTVQVPLQIATFSVGEDFPIGSNIRVQRVRGFHHVDATCTNSGAYARFSLVGGSLYPGQSNIYQTGISGLGVRFRNPYENKYYPFNTNWLGTLSADGWLVFTIELVKMGPITNGTVNTALFPEVRIDAVDADNKPSRVAWHSITGSFTLQTPTCTTPNFTWDLGTTNTTVLKKQGDASPWVDTPVTLTGCSAFLGNNSNGSYTQYNISGFNIGSTSQSGSLAPNKLTMTLRPNTSATDSINGIVALDSTSTASGFGVQVASKQSGTYVAQNLSGSMVVTPAVGDSSGTVSFPLGARIIRTSNTVQGGKISTSLTYIINYQ